MTVGAATDSPADPIEQLPKAVYRTIIADLYAFVPSPDLTDPELIAERIRAAIASIASMVPVNADEAAIALRVVLADAQGRDCMRHANMHFNDTNIAMKCRAQANHCHRTANAARALLLRVQADRHKREAVQKFCEQDAWTIHVTESYLLQADGHNIPEPEPPRRQAEAPQPPVATDNKVARYDMAEQYAAIYPRRAAEIRAYGGIPPAASWGRLDQETVQALLASTSPLILQLDQEYADILRA